MARTPLHPVVRVVVAAQLRPKTEWEAWNVWPFGCLVPLSGISHGNPSRIPPWAGDGSVAPAGAGQMVSLPSCCFSNILCPTTQPACANYLSLPYVHLLSDGSCLSANSCTAIAHFNMSLCTWVFSSFGILVCCHVVRIKTVPVSEQQSWCFLTCVLQNRI